MRLPSEFSSPVLLGKGSYSYVYRVYQQRLDRSVAVKLFRSLSKKKIRAICSEAQTLGKLTIPCVPHVYDISCIGKQAYIVMEWIRGVPLDRLLQKPLSLSLRRTIATKLIEAVSLLHAQNIAHKDLKPQNIIVTPDNRLYLIDFGFSSGNTIVSSQNKTIQGTPRYIAPESWVYEQPIDHCKCDIYALGILLDDLLADDIPEHLKHCSSQEPAQRPETVYSFFSSWKKSNCFSNTSPEWQPVISRAAHEYLTAQLFTASQYLKHKGQIKSAYQVLAELLDEAPDHAEAIMLLQSLSIGKSKRGSALAVVASVLITVFGAASFFTGKFLSQSGSISQLQFRRPYSTDSLITVHSHSRKNNRMTYFRDDAGFSLISAELFCLLPDTSGTLSIDGRRIDTLSVTMYPEIQLLLDQGVHSIKWTSRKTSATAVESVTLLPFEKKRIKLSFLKE